MKLFKYVYYRVYKNIEEKNDDAPAVRSLLFVGVLVSIIWGFGMILLDKILNRLSFDLLVEFPRIDKSISYILWILGVIVYSYIRYGRKSINYYEELFEDKKWVNSYVKVWMILVLPVIFLIVGGFFFCILFGGEIMGHEIGGLFNL